MERCRRGRQLLKVVYSSRQRNKQYYHELSAVDRRKKISDLLERGISVFEIAKTVQCYRSTVYREIKRGHKGNIYCPNEGQMLSIKKRRAEQRVNTAYQKDEWIYRFVAQDKRLGDKLYRHLRQGYKRYRRGKKEKAPAIKNAVSIDDRPSIVDSKERLGDWEIDTVLSKHGMGAMVTDMDIEFALSRINYRPRKCLGFKQPAIIF